MSQKPTYEELERRVREPEEAKQLTESSIYMDAIGDVLIVLNQHRQVTRLNKAAIELLGFSDDEVHELTFEKLFPEKEHKKHYEEMKIGIDTGTVRPFETLLLTKQGREIPVLFSGTALKDVQGEPAGFVGVARDITDRKQMEEDLRKAHGELEERVERRTAELSKANLDLKHEVAERKRIEQALRKSEERYRDVVENANDAIVITQGPDIKFHNRRTEEFLGYSAGELDGIPFTDLIHPEDREMLIERQVRRLRGEDIPSTYPFRVMNKVGETLWVETNAVSISWEEKPAVLSFIRDISEQEQLRSMLQQAQKMEAIGTLAGGVAHDFNNILGIIVGNAELAMQDVPDWNPAYRNLDEVRKACLRAKEMVRQILAFSRQTEALLKPVQIRGFVEESLRLLRSSIPTTIEIRENFTNRRDTILADPTQLNQILLNLASNAAHAMRETGGVMEVGLRDVRLGEQARGQYQDLTPGDYLVLTVRDTGHGIEPDILDRIFDPYFTTKEHGQGTGMGLSVVHGIAKSHKGASRVESRPGEGATFEVYLPLVEGDSEPDSEETSALPSGTERVLFVDDEEALADVGERMFMRLGYEVTVRTSSVEALADFRAEPGRFDLVVTDMTMPEMTGVELSRELLRIRPDLPIILCTGFSEMITEEGALEQGIRAFVMKPLAVRDIAETARRVLDRGQPE